MLLCILWSRLGTRLPGQYTCEDGSVYDSGTAFELETARTAFQRNGRPDILVYRKTAPPLIEVSDRTEREPRTGQWDQLADYLQDWFINADGSVSAGFTQFEHIDQFEALLEEHMRRLIRELLQVSGGATSETPVNPTSLSGSPFRGLAAFDVEHAEIFHGRTRAITHAKDRLALNGNAFLMVTGVSGAGKSWLTRAGAG